MKTNAERERAGWPGAICIQKPAADVEAPPKRSAAKKRPTPPLEGAEAVEEAQQPPLDQPEHKQEVS